MSTGRRRPTTSDIRPPNGAATAPRAEIPSRTKPVDLRVAALDLLDEERDEDERPMKDHRCPEDAEDGTRVGAAPEQPRVDRRVPCPKLEQDECDEDDRRGEKTDGRWTAIFEPPQPSEDGHEKEPKEDETRDVDRSGARGVGCRARRHRASGRRGAAHRHRREHGDRDRDEEQGAPAERRDEQPADQRSDRRARRDEHVEQAECRTASVGGGHRPEQRHRAGRDERAADRLEDA